jgi:hypothetical protein
VIHDVKRNLSAVYDKKSWIITDISPENTLITKEEEDYENLWKIYYKNISIDERKI